MKNGFIKLHRQIQDNWLWKSDEPFDKRSAWIDLILMANWEESTHLINGQLVKQRRGEVLTSIGYLAKRWKWSMNKVRRFVEQLTAEGMVRANGTSYGTSLSIEKYAFFQGGADEPNTQTARKKTLPLTQKQQGSNKEVTTYKEYKEEKEEKENKEVVVGKPTPPTPDQVRDYAKSIGYEIDAEYFCDYYRERGWIKKDGTPIADWQATIRNGKRNERKADAEPERNSEQSQFNFKTTADWLDDE